MRRTILLVSVVALLLLTVALPVAAVQFGEPDVDPVKYPSVGLLVTYPGSGPYVYLCTVALIDPNTVLTAGHCTEEALPADPDAPMRFAYTAVGFRQHYPWICNVQPDGFCHPDSFWGAADTILGSPVTHPDFAFPSFDVGIVNLYENVSLTPMQLAAPGTLDAVAGKKPLLNVVGYGRQDSLPPTLMSLLDRYRGTVKLNNLGSNTNGTYGTVQFSANPGAAHSGGTCFGDSGGPVLYGNKITAVNSFVMNQQCMGNGWGFRVDNLAIQNWIQSVDVDLP